MTLPKARLFWIRRNKGGPVLARFRHANSMTAYIGPVVFGWRLPWLKQAAQQLHPERFNDPA